MKSKLYLLLLSCLLMAGCSSPRSHTQRNLVLENKSSRDMHETTMTLGDYQCAFGAVKQGRVAGIAKFPRPITQLVKVYWQAKGLEHNEVVHLGSVVPPGKSGTIIITVYDDRVVPRFEPDATPSK